MVFDSKKYDKKRYTTPKRRAYVLIRTAKQRAETQHLEFNLTNDWLLKILLIGECQVSGLSFDFKPSKGKSKNPYAPSIDRINPKKGYIKSNCQIVLHAVNQAKGEMSMKEYREITELIVGELCDYI